MKAFSKKYLLSLVLIFMALEVFAQQGQQAQSQQGQNLSASSLKHRLGGYFSYEPTVGALSEFVSCSMGGGLEYELGFPLLEIFEIGPAAHFSVNGNLITDDRLTFMMNLKADIGCFFRIPLWKSGFVFSPEIDYGILVYFPKANSEYANADSLKTSYVDQLIQIGLGFRYSHKKVLNGNLEFELTPTYLFSAEQEDVIHYIGFRAGALYRIGGKK
ncbi:MAG: hypothetical protein K5839_01280 [Treponemataceae bacterium]|nr:hypothetical protein [Treponemataceae bacterium]